jgi:hypothetical protein
VTCRSEINGRPAIWTRDRGWIDANTGQPITPAPSCLTCRRREEFRGHDICACGPEDWTMWDCLAARKATGPCGPDGKRFRGVVEPVPTPADPPRRTYWQERRAGCLVCAGGALLFWFGVWLLTTIAWR